MNENKQISFNLWNHRDSLADTSYQLQAIQMYQKAGSVCIQEVRTESPPPHLSVNCSKVCLPQRFPSSIKQWVINQYIKGEINQIRLDLNFGSFWEGLSKVFQGLSQVCKARSMGWVWPVDELCRWTLCHSFSQDIGKIKIWTRTFLTTIGILSPVGWVLFGGFKWCQGAATPFWWGQTSWVLFCFALPKPGICICLSAPCWHFYL